MENRHAMSGVVIWVIDVVESYKSAPLSCFFLDTLLEQFDKEYRECLLVCIW